ncbi:MAG TPA: FxSxx-COOH cyclophane-containing RiPP peptide [Streptomyces sp.]|nr:FxSxx-COOH cyclophane-containing RiPP peptide [Streptomyces sp.]
MDTDIRNEAAGEPVPGGRRTGATAQAPPGVPPAPPLPDLLTLDLAQLGSIDHPVLREVLGELRARATEPSEMLWGFDNSF